MAGVNSKSLVSWLREASRVVVAASEFLRDIAGFLRQLVHIAGWAVLLFSAPGLLLSHPRVAAGLLAGPAIGALAVLQGMVKPRRRGGERRMTARRRQH